MDKNYCRTPVHVKPFQILKAPAAPSAESSAALEEMSRHLRTQFNGKSPFALKSKGIFIPEAGAEFELIEPTGVLFIYDEDSGEDSSTVLMPGRYKVISVREEGNGAVGCSYWLRLIKTAGADQPRRLSVKAAIQTFDGYISSIDWRGVRGLAGGIEKIQNFGRN